MSKPKSDMVTGLANRYTTGDEMLYLQHIGKHSENADACALGPAELLRRYIQAAELRFDWGEINKKVVLKFARQRLAHFAQQ